MDTEPSTLMIWTPEPSTLMIRTLRVFFLKREKTWRRLGFPSLLSEKREDLDSFFQSPFSGTQAGKIKRDFFSLSFFFFFFFLRVNFFFFLSVKNFGNILHV